MYFADLTRDAGRDDFEIGEEVRILGDQGRQPVEIIAAFVEPAARAGQQAGR